jgi:hypothetical protein
VDGRTSSNTGMYGAELAETLGKLGAWVAFNIDGGGSTQLWVDGAHVNSPTEASRSVANHWGVFADEDWLSDRAGSCVSADVCEVIPPEGGLLDELGECFRSFGDREFWREESAGEGGHLYWTNAFQSDTPGNLAWWQLELEEAGRYGVEVYVDPDHGQFVSTGYVLRVGSTDHALTLDQGSASGWTSLGEFELNEGGRQWLQVNDHVDVSPPTDRRIVVDAIRLVRLDLPVEDTGDSGQDSGPDSMPGDSAPAVEGHDTPGSRVRIEGCGLPSAPGWLLSGLALMLVRRRL